ncbi:LCP family protein [Streptomyces oceani]|uniref:LytR family transcriptional regulator n=1 Tax=Streptomyces oceani TaxID=1075402 RepID=A0A1E7KNK0_9ACTN|nr:LCP family protein [Streptomyces oceani]OEV05466.1 LytR family transcriptional regulator [Streptomyces oceani]
MEDFRNVDEHDRPHAGGEVDPADQWVFNPSTGSYELRLDSADDSSVNSAASTPRQGGGRRRTPPRQRRAVPASTTEGDDDTTQLQVPNPRRPREDRSAESGSTSGRRAAGSSRRKAKAKPSRKKQVLRWTGGAMGLILVAGCAGGFWLYQKLNGNLNDVDVGIDNPATSDGPINILILGTDDRQGKGNKGYGDTGSVGHADTTLLFHVSADRSNATVLSIPRDMIVDIPKCPTKQEDGSTKVIPAEQDVRFNTSLGQRGRDPGCTWRTVQEIVGVEINHFMMADFNAVKELSSAVGGVEVCVAEDINDPKSHLKLDAGRHTIEGEQALAFVRTRHSVGTGSDLSRIKLQQQFLSSMIRKMKSSGTLTDPGKLYDLSNAATKALTVDSGIGSIKKLVELGKDLRRVDTENVTFATVPVVDNPQDPATVVLNESAAEPLFKMVQQDKSLTKTDKGKKKDKGPDLKKVEKAPASEVAVDILNGGGPAGAAQSTVTWLQSEGVTQSTNAGNASETLDETRLEYAPDQAGQAKALAEMLELPRKALKESDDGQDAAEPMTLTLGEDFTEAGEPIGAPEKAPEGVDDVNASDKNVCAK